MKNRFLIVGTILVVSILVLGCTAGRSPSARVTATPTKTARPVFTATFTPEPSPTATDTPVPTDTPLPPTDTPLPTDTPQPTDTSLPPTAEALPSDTPVPTNTSAPQVPTNTPRPRPTNTALPTTTPSPKLDFVIIEITPFVDGSIQASGFHNIYFTVIDAGGQPMDNVILQDTLNQPPYQDITGDKGPGKTEFEMLYADYKFKVAGDTSGRTYTSEVTHMLSMIPGHYYWPDMIAAGICDTEAECQAMGPVHFSYNITFQRTW